MRGRGRTDARESYELVCELAGRREPAIERLRAADDPLAELRAVLEESARCAFGLDARVRRDGPAATQVRAWSAALGTLRALDGIKKRRIFIHINNTNPIQIEGSPERAKVEAAGWQVAEDGMEIVL